MQIDILQISALRGTGIDELIEYLKKQTIKKTRLKIFPENVEKTIAEIEKKNNLPDGRFIAVKLLERDRLFKDLLNKEIEER